jgi:acetyl esterase/lipase
MKILLDRYTAGGASPTDPLISPLHASLDELKGLPPHWISCGEYDTLRDQGVLYSEKLKKAGVDVVLTITEGQQHVFEFMAGRAKEADDSLSNIGKWVQGKLGA